MTQQADDSLLTMGTTISVLTTVPSTYTVVKGVRDITGAGFEKPLIRATDLADLVEKYHLGRGDGTEITMTMRVIFGDVGQEFLRDAHDDGAIAKLKVTYPNTGTRIFDVLVRSWPEAVNDGEHLTVEAGLKVVSTIARTDPP